MGLLALDGSMEPDSGLTVASSGMMNPGCSPKSVQVVTRGSIQRDTETQETMERDDWVS